MIGLIFSLIGLSYTLAKGAISALTVIYPSYKSYKALESRSLEASQAMLLYWCIIAFVGAVKEFTDQLLGTYANFFIWKFAILGLKAAPLILGPDRLYNSIVKPLFAANEESVDAVVDEARKVKSIASSAAPKIKSGDTQAAKGAAAEIAGVVQKDAADLVHTIQAQALELTDQLQAKSAELGVVWDKKGVAGMLDRTIDWVEQAREFGMSFASDRWQEHGPMIKSHAATLQGKAGQYAPVAKERALGVWQSSVQPKLAPVMSQYDSKLKPFVLSKADQVNTLWIEKGGPVRSFYLQRAQPFLNTQLKPFVTRAVIPWLVDSFLPAVYETLIALKDRITDLAATPSDEVKAHRAHHKRRRADARKERRSARASGQEEHGAIYKRQKIEAKADISESKQPEISEDLQQNVTTSEGAFTTAPSYPTSPVVEGGVSSGGSASLKNRKTGSVTDSSILSAPGVENSNAALAGVIEAKDLKAEKAHLHHIAGPDGWSEGAMVDMSAKTEPVWQGDAKLVESLSKSDDVLLGSKHSNSPAGEKGAAWGGEPRANDIAAE